MVPGGADVVLCMLGCDASIDSCICQAAKCASMSHSSRAMHQPACPALPRSLSGGGSSLEPNNLVFPPENCAGGNFSNSYTGASGWGDQNCDKQHPFICEMHGALPPRQRVHTLDTPTATAS